MKHLFFKLLILANAFIILFSCEKSEFEQNPPGKFDTGAFFVNEGTYGGSNASVSFLKFNEDSVIPEIFMTENLRPLGDVLQSMYINNNKAYLVVNASNKVEVVKISDFKETGTIEGLSEPRNITVSNEKAYISQWGNEGSVAVVDLSSLQISDTIETGAGTEGIINVGDKVWAANGGGFGLDSTISVIDPEIDTIVNTINVGYNPKEMITDKSGDVWVLCYGHIVYNSDWTIGEEFPSKLVKISGDDETVISEMVIGETLHPQHIDRNPEGDKIYVGGGFGFPGLYEVNIDDTSFPSEPLIDGLFYGFNINPANGDIYTCEALNFTAPGTIYKFSETGTLITEYTAGIGPNAVVF